MSFAARGRNCNLGWCCVEDCRATFLHQLWAMTTRRVASPVGIGGSIRLFRGLRVILDQDLASLYGVTTKALNQAVRRNRERFPSDFMIHLTRAEAESLRSQLVTLKKGRGRHRKYQPYVFTEQGVAMLSSVLRSSRAIAVNIEIMRAFVELRRMLETTTGLARKITTLERRYDRQFKVVLDAIRELMSPTKSAGRRIGYRRESTVAVPGDEPKSRHPDKS